MKNHGIRTFARRGCVAILAATLSAAWGAQSALAESFSWGDVEATDELGKIVMGLGATTDFDKNTGVLTISGDVSTITFDNKDDISNITGVTFSASLDLVSTDAAPPFDPQVLSSTFSGGGFTITEHTKGYDLLSGIWGVDGVELTLTDFTGFVFGSLDADVFNLQSGSSDFLDAFGTHGTFDQQLSFGQGRLCTTVLDCPENELASFSTTGVSNVTHAPEPGTFTLLMVGLAGLGVRRRAQVRR